MGIANFDRIIERCSCGATFDLMAYLVTDAAERWRRDHRHTEPVHSPADRERPRLGRVVLRVRRMPTVPRRKLTPRTGGDS